MDTTEFPLFKKPILKSQWKFVLRFKHLRPIAQIWRRTPQGQQRRFGVAYNCTWFPAMYQKITGLNPIKVYIFGKQRSSAFGKYILLQGSTQWCIMYQPSTVNMQHNLKSLLACGFLHSIYCWPQRHRFFNNGQCPKLFYIHNLQMISSQLVQLSVLTNLRTDKIFGCQSE